ncbi:hypothetical protein [Halopenitus persicus]|uniref:hypothetical protein n=1 Tax=Halopenitus persicus TaxID=1048396 RepID=UPI000BBAE3B2|nr:hypothetical protein [Halopenitus persicus]
MSRSTDGTVPADSRSDRPERIRHAAEQLETVLQSLDLEEEAQLADELIEAIRATDRASDLATTARKPDREPDGFRFTSSPTDGESSRDR